MNTDPRNKNSYASHPKQKDMKPSRNTSLTKIDSKSSTGNETSHIPELLSGNIRIIHLGGVEETGRNMSIVEYKDTILVIDCGVQFTETNTPGIDFILPNTRYLEENKHKVKGVIITHAHLDYSGGIPYIIPRIGTPPLYARLFTATAIKKRQETFAQQPALSINVIEQSEEVTIGDLQVTFTGIKESSPSELGIIISTPHGDIVHNGNLRVDHIQGVPTEEEQARYKIFENRKNLVLMGDSANCENTGFSISNTEIKETIEKAISETKNRLTVIPLTSQVERIVPIITLLEKYNRKIVLEGKIVKNIVEIATSTGMLTVKPDTFIPVESMHLYPQETVSIVISGEQGEGFTALSKIAFGGHKNIIFGEHDTILLANSETPSLRRPLQAIKDKLSRGGAHLTHYKTSDVSSSGHPNADELIWIHKKINPKFFIPVHGYHYMLRVHADLERKLGTSEDNIIIPDNGMIIEIRNEGTSIVTIKEKAPSEMIVVDGTSVGKIQDVVMRDRQTLAEDGMFVVIGVIDSHTHTLKKSPDLISRGFVYLKESQDLLYQTRLLTKKVIDDSLAHGGYSNLDQMKQDIAESTTKFLLQKTAKRPVIIPVIISV